MQKLIIHSLTCSKGDIAFSTDTIPTVWFIWRSIRRISRGYKRSKWWESDRWYIICKHSDTVIISSGLLKHSNNEISSTAQVHFSHKRIYTKLKINKYIFCYWFTWYHIIIYELCMMIYNTELLYCVNNTMIYIKIIEKGVYCPIQLYFDLHKLIINIEKENY